MKAQTSPAVAPILLIEDEPSVTAFLRAALERHGYAVANAASGAEGLQMLTAGKYSGVISDIRMPGMSGLDLQATLNADRCPIPTIFITAHGDEDMRLQAMRGGAVKFMVKPFDCAILLESVRAALEADG